MTNGNNDVRELEDLLTELEGQGALPVGHYSEEDDAVTQLMDAPLGEQEWMVQITPHDRRMMSTDQILGELATGNLVTPDMLVWRSGMGDWSAISTIDELRVGRAVMDAVPERRPLPAPPPPPAPIPPRINSNGLGSNGLGSSALASPSPIGRAPLPPPPSVPFVPPPAPPPVDVAPLPVFGAAAPAPSPAPELNPFSPPPAIGSSSRGSAPGSIPAPAPVTARVNTHGPVAVDFSEMEPPRTGVSKLLVGSAIAAMLMIGGTVYALSAGGVFEATPQVSSEVASKPVAAAAAPAAAEAAPKPAEPEPSAAEAPAAAGSTEPQTQPASVKEMEAEPAPSEAPTAAADEGEKASAEGQKSEEASSDEEEASSAPSSSKGRKAARRNRRGGSQDKAEEKAASAEREKPQPRRAPERRSKARAAAVAAPEVATGEQSEEAPKAADQPGSTFNKQAAKTALDEAAAKASNCRPAGGPSGAGRVQVRYEPNGKVGAVTLLTPSFENTTTGDCVVMVFRRAAIPSFTGSPAVVMNKNFEIP